MHDVQLKTLQCSFLSPSHCHLLTLCMGCACEGGETADVHAEDDGPITRLLRNRLTMPRTVATIVKMHPKAKQSRPPRKPPENMAGKDCRR